MSVWDQKWKRERERRRDMRKTTHRWTVHSLFHIGDPPDIPCREVSVELFALENTDDGEDIERGGGGGGGETSVSVGSEMEKRERDRGDMRKTIHGWTVVHSLIHIGDLPDNPCREVSVELIAFKTLMMETTTRGRGGGGGETSVSVWDQK